MVRFEKDWIFVSDAHFTGRDPEAIQVFLKFLDSEKERMGHLVILGDLFEFLFGFKNFCSAGTSSVFTGYLPVFHKLQNLHRHGIRIKYFEGNHDFFLDSFFSEQFGMEVEVYAHGADERLGAMKAFIAHGDLSNPKQWTYRVFRRILKNACTYHLIHLAGPKISRWVAQKLGQMSYQKYHHNDQPVPPPAFRAFAHQKFLEKFDVVILGHSHFSDQFEEQMGARRCLYYNVGAWLVHRSFLRFTPPDGFKLDRFLEG